MPVTTSTNMGMPIPIVGQELGPTWASDLNASFGIVDTHDHSTGKGTPVITAGININADLGFGGFNATLLRSSRYVSQGSPLALSSDKDCVYVSGVDLYYNDGSGNQIRLTQSGAISGSPGNISGLGAPASASYSAGTQTFTWQADINVPAKMDMGSIVIREDAVTSPNGITISSPSALVANYTLTLPTALPSSGTQVVSIDTSGNMTLINSGTYVGPGGSYATITAAIAATSAGGYITVLPGTYTENITLTKQLTIIGQGFGTILNGTMTFGSGSSHSFWSGFNHQSNAITINSGVVDIGVFDFYVTSKNQVTNNGTGSLIQGWEI